MSIIDFFSQSGFSGLSFLLALFFLLALSSYVKIVTVLSILRVGLGLGSLPSVLVTTGLALSLSFFVMEPVLQRSAVAMDGVRSSGAADSAVLEAGAATWKNFLLRHTHEEEMEEFFEVAKRIDGNQAAPDLSISSWRVVAPAFIVSELKEAFATGVSLFLPFLIIDLFVATVLVAVGYDQYNPMLVSFPCKLLLFVLVDGWSLITTNLVETYAL